MTLSLKFALLIGLCPSLAIAAGFPKFEAQEIDKHVGNVCYAVTTADVNGDKKPDVVAVAEDAVYWYENPTWTKHTIIKNATERDNVCIQAHDIDGDGQIDFALGASWQPANTKSGGTLQWLTRTGAKQGEWRVISIASEPTLHRIRWGDLLGTGKKQLIVAPLQGRDTKGPNWNEGKGVRLLAFEIPADPFKDQWPSTLIDDRLHTTHNLQIFDFNKDGKDDLVVAGWEGVFLYYRAQGKFVRTVLGQGNQTSKPFKGASEVKVGTLRDGTKYVGTIEPWHGTQVVVYHFTGKGKTRIPERQIIAEPLAWGHAVWCADLDGDGDEEMIIGQRDPNKGDTKPKGPGLFVFDPKPGSSPLAFDRHTIDDGGMATEDAMAEDLDGDGRPDLIAGGRATHNVKIYWNKPSK
jgi:hypothetical protein